MNETTTHSRRAPRRFWGWGNADDTRRARDTGAARDAASARRAYRIARRAARRRVRFAVAAHRAAGGAGRAVLGRTARPAQPRRRQELRRRRTHVAAPTAAAAGLGSIPRERAGDRRHPRLGAGESARGDSLRRRQQRVRRRRGCSGQRLRRRRLAGHGAARSRARGRPGQPRRAHPGRRAGAGPGGATESARPDAAPLPAELRVLDAGRLDRHPCGRPLCDAAHAHRRLRRVHTAGDTGRHRADAAPAGVRCGPGAGSAGVRLGGHARRAHRGLDALAAPAELPRLGRGAFCRLRRGDARPACTGPIRARPEQRAPARCGRNGVRRRRRWPHGDPGAWLRVGRPRPGGMDGTRAGTGA